MAKKAGLIKEPRHLAERGLAYVLGDELAFEQDFGIVEEHSKQLGFENIQKKAEYQKVLTYGASLLPVYEKDRPACEKYKKSIQDYVISLGGNPLDDKIEGIISQQ